MRGIENDQLKRTSKKFIEDNRVMEDEYAKHIKEAVLLRALGLERSKSALEMGSGWGNYSLDIARETETLTCPGYIGRSVELYPRKGEREKHR